MKYDIKEERYTKGQLKIMLMQNRFQMMEDIMNSNNNMFFQLLNSGISNPVNQIVQYQNIKRYFDKLDKKHNSKEFNLTKQLLEKIYELSPDNKPDVIEYFTKITYSEKDTNVFK